MYEIDLIHVTILMIRKIRIVNSLKIKLIEIMTVLVIYRENHDVKRT